MFRKEQHSVVFGFHLPGNKSFAGIVDLQVVDRAADDLIELFRYGIKDTPP